MARKKTNIVSLRGAAIPVPHINQAVVETVESLLSDAKGGRIVGFAYARVAPEGHVTTGWAGNADGHSMIAGVALLAHRVTKAGDTSE
jgi:hypothetical protein